MYLITAIVRKDELEDFSNFLNTKCNSATGYEKDCLESEYNILKDSVYSKDKDDEFVTISLTAAMDYFSRLSSIALPLWFTGHTESSYPLQYYVKGEVIYNWLNYIYDEKIGNTVNVRKVNPTIPFVIIGD